MFVADEVWLYKMAAKTTSVTHEEVVKIECPICCHNAVMRQLPCEHLLCLQCIGK